MRNEPVRPLFQRVQLVALAAELGVRPDWHEPDEQGVTARVEGTPLNFDNAMGPGSWYGSWRPGEQERAELHVILSRRIVEGSKATRGEDIATVNLATLFAWASETGSEDLQWRKKAMKLQAELDELRTRLRTLGGAA